MEKLKLLLRLDNYLRFLGMKNQEIFLAKDLRGNQIFR